MRKGKERDRGRVSVCVTLKVRKKVGGRERERAERLQTVHSFFLMNEEQVIEIDRLAMAGDV